MKWKWEAGVADKVWERNKKIIVFWGHFWFMFYEFLTKRGTHVESCFIETHVVLHVAYQKHIFLWKIKVQVNTLGGILI